MILFQYIVIDQLQYDRDVNKCKVRVSETRILYREAIILKDKNGVLTANAAYILQHFPSVSMLPSTIIEMMNLENMLKEQKYTPTAKQE